MHFSAPHTPSAAAFLRRWQLPLLIGIAALAAFLRFYQLPDMPPGLFSDEGWSGVMARQVMQTGQLQVFFPSNQGVEPIVVYLAVPILAIFGSPVWQLRIPEAIVGTLTIVALWWMCREMFGRRSAPPERAPSEDEYVTSSVIGLGAAFVLATLFWHINLSRIGMEPILVPFFMCVAFGALARAIDTRRGRDYALAGAALALNLYTYKAGYAVPPLAALFVGYMALTERGTADEPSFLKREWRHLLIWVGVAVVCYIPMMTFIVAHPDAFFTRFGSVTVESRVTPQIDLGSNAIKTLKMFFIEGDENQRYNIPDRPALDPLLAILFMGGLGVAISGWRKARQGLPALWLAVMSLPTMLSEFAPQWGRAVGVTPMLAVLPAMGAAGAWWLAARAPRKWIAPAALGAAGLALAVSAGISARDYFVTFKQESFLFYSFDEGPLRLSQYVNTVPTDQRVYVITDLPESYTLQYVIDRPYLTYDGRNGTVYPPPNLPATQVAILQRTKTMLKAIQTARPDSKVTWQVKDRDGAIFARGLALPAAADPAPNPPHTVEATLDGKIGLLGYDVDTAKLAPGDKLTLMVYWRSLAAVDKDYTVFVHLVADQPLPNGDTVLTNNDRQPIGASYPTSGWLPGETILDRHLLIIPADAPAGTYHIHVGMYLLETLTRLPAADSAGKPISGDTIELGTVEIAPK